MSGTHQSLLVAFIVAFAPIAWTQAAAAQPEGAEGETVEAEPEAPPEPEPPAPAPAAPKPAATPAAPPAAPPPVEEDRDGARFRGGVDATFGGLIASRDQFKVTGFTGGVNGHIGVQIMDLIGIYAVPHIAFGKITQKVEAGGQTLESSSGWLAITGTAVIDFTFIDHIFVGVGGGGTYAGPTCTNCQALGGGVLHVRAGGYPVVDFGEDGIRRKGLSIGFDLYVDFVHQLSAALVGVDTSTTIIEPMLTIGYEAF